MKNLSPLQKSVLPMCFFTAIFFRDRDLMDYFHHSRFFAFSLLFLGLAIYALISGQRKNSASSHLITRDLILGLFVLWQAFTVLWANEPTEAIFNAQKWILFFSMCFLIRLLYSGVSGEMVGRWVSILALAFSIPVMVFTIWQILEVGLTGGFDNEHMYEIRGMFGHRSLVAAFLSLLLPLLWVGSFQWKLNMGRILATILIVLIILVLQSRSAYLALALFLMALIGGRIIHLHPTRMGWRRVLLGIVLIGGMVTLLIWNPSIRERLNIGDYFKSQTATERQLVWLRTLPLISEKPLVGWGGGNWKLEFPRLGVEGNYRMMEQDVFFTRAHNDWLEILVESGFVGLFICIAFMFWDLGHIVRMLQKQDRGAAMLLAGLGSYLIFSLIDFPKERIEILFMLALYFSLMEIMFPSPTKKWRFGKFLNLILILLLSFNVLNGYWRYHGEKKAKQMLQARGARDWQMVLNHSDKIHPSYRFDPNSVPLDYYRGLAKYHLQKKDEAQMYFLNAHRFSPYNFHVLNNLATIELDRENFDQAHGWLEKALIIHPQFEDALYNMAYCKTRQGKYQEALQTLSSIRDSEKKSVFEKEIQRIAGESLPQRQ